MARSSSCLYSFAMAKIQLKRAYDPPEEKDGARFLVDRLWPRGIKKEDLHLSGWLKEIAPSNALRKWFGHDPDQWEEFQRRYLSELEGKTEALQTLQQALRKGPVTLVYAAKDTERNNAVVLKEFLAA